MNRKEIREKKKELNVLNDVITIVNQYFPQLINKFEGLTDLRHQSYVTYKMKVIQIAHIIRQLLENGIKEIKELKLKLKEISQQIKTMLISTIPNLTVHKKVQLRFD